MVFMLLSAGFLCCFCVLKSLGKLNFCVVYYPRSVPFQMLRFSNIHELLNNEMYSLYREGGSIYFDVAFFFYIFLNWFMELFFDFCVPDCGGAVYASEMGIPVIVFPERKSAQESFTAKDLVLVLRFGLFLSFVVSLCYLVFLHIYV